MIRTRVISNKFSEKLTFLFFCLCLPLTTYHLPLAHAARLQVENVVVTEEAGGSTAHVVIESSRKLNYNAEEIEEPPQIKVTFQDEIGCGKELPIKGGQKLVSGISYDCGDSNDAKKSGQFLRSLTVQLKEKCSFTVSQKDWIITITLNKSASAENPAAANPSSAFPKSQISSSYKMYQQAGLESSFLFEIEPPRMLLSPNPTLDEFVQVALANHKPLDIAQQELSLAKRKHFEARRSFFPALTAKGTHITGQTYTGVGDPNDPANRADFTRQEVGLEVGQPLFQSGRIYYGLRQAKAQKEIAELQIIKITEDVTGEVLKAAYAFIQQKESLSLRRALQIESGKIVELTKKKKEIGVASESEYLGVLSAGSQVDYSVASQEKDMEMARAHLAALLNLDTIPTDMPLTLMDLYARMPPMDLELEHLLPMALTNRPEIKMAVLTRQFREYSKRTARAENMLKIDLSGFVGKSGSAYQREELSMRDSYNIGLKGVWNFFGNNVTPMASQDKTAPDLGSTSRTETRSQSVTVGFLDGMEAGTNLRQADIDEEKSKDDLRKSRKDILLELREAFYNYQKARLQIESSRIEVDYRKKDAAIAQAKDRLHQIEAPQMLQAMSSYTEAESKLREAIAFYMSSIAALEKAIGTKLMQ